MRLFCLFLPSQNWTYQNAMDSTDYTDSNSDVIRGNPWNLWRFSFSGYCRTVFPQDPLRSG